MYGILAGIVICFLIPTCYLFVAKEVFSQGTNYVWVMAFFISKVLAYCVTNPLVILIIARYVSNEKRRGNLDSLIKLSKNYRESLIVWEDYQFALAFQRSKM